MAQQVFCFNETLTNFVLFLDIHVGKCSWEVINWKNIVWKAQGVPLQNNAAYPKHQDEEKHLQTETVDLTVVVLICGKKISSLFSNRGNKFAKSYV